MAHTQHSLTIRAPKQGLLEITNEITRWVAHASVTMGLLTLFLRHTSASILIQENADPDVLADMENFFANLAPEDNSLYRHIAEGPDEMPAEELQKIFTQVVATPEPLALNLRAAVKAPLTNRDICNSVQPRFPSGPARIIPVGD